MKVLLVNGSPHTDGNTAIALGIISKQLAENGIETETVYLAHEKLIGCQACGSCRSTGKCAFNPLVNEFREKAKDADGFIFGTPVHYGSISGLMKCFMDTLFYSNRSDYFYLKPAAGVFVARRAGTVSAMDDLNKYFTISNMLVVSSFYWNNIHGAKAPEALEDKEGVDVMKTLANNMAYVIRCQKAAKENGIDRPDRLPASRTNF
ncbi:MAG: flavodoxin family protein, partial [Erysipelotrichaceae bacterium]|nr:flavodoxin family protein [Erysipelotrichaceae bacterium]